MILVILAAVIGSKNFYRVKKYAGLTSLCLVVSVLPCKANQIQAGVCLHWSGVLWCSIPMDADIV